MIYLKKICLTLLLIISVINFNVFADGEATIIVSHEDANAGDTVQVAVSLAENPGIISMLLKIDYDSDVLNLVNVKDEGLLGTAFHSDDMSLNPYRLFWLNGTVEEDIKENGTVATLTFNVSDNAKTGIYPIKVSYDKDSSGIVNFDLETVDFKTVDGYISVIGKSSGTQSDVDSQNIEEAKEISVILDGKYLEFPDQKPIIKDDRTLVPLRAIFEALDAYVGWNDEEKRVISIKGDTTISLTIGSDQLYVNGNAKTIDVPAQIINDRTMVPLRAVAESFGCDVDWDGRTKTVIITN